MVISVSLGAQSYPILLEAGALARAGQHLSLARRVLVVTDSGVPREYAQTVACACRQARICTLPAGENSKNMDNYQRLLREMLALGMDRGDCVAAVGGGMAGDLAGFAAATYMRGVDFYNVPTTLLAQVDSSVGGKTGVDLPMGKNLCGAFHQPILVLIDPQVLRTLPDVFFSDGMGEVIKYGCIRSAELFALLEQASAKDRIHEIIYACVDMKRVVVEHDEKEAGERALLNFGHTAGHAIEKLWNYQTVTHGAAVGIGMVLAARAGEGAGLTEPGTADRIAALLQKYNLPVADTHSIDEIVDAMQADKKRTADGMKLVLLRKIGDSFIDPVDLSTLRTMFGGGACK